MNLFKRLIRAISHDPLSTGWPQYTTLMCGKQPLTVIVNGGGPIHMLHGDGIQFDGCGTRLEINAPTGESEVQHG